MTGGVPKTVAAELEGVYEGNYIGYDRLLEIGILTCEEISNILLEHCGPESSDALLVTADGMPSKSTRDGINILSFVRFNSEVMELYRDSICHVGKTIEAMAGDGTTSAMLIACEFLKELFKLQRTRMDEKKPFESKLRSKYDFKNVTDEIMCQIKANYVCDLDLFKERGRITGDESDNLKEFTKRIAEATAHGDTELAEFLSSTVVEFGKDFDGITVIERQGEPDSPMYEIEYDKGQYVTEGSLINAGTGIYNEENNTEYSKEAVKIVCVDNLIDNSVEMKVIHNAIASKVVDSDLIIITGPGGYDFNCISVLDELHFGLTGHRVVGFALGSFSLSKCMHDTINDLLMLRVNAPAIIAGITEANAMAFKSTDVPISLNTFHNVVFDGDVQIRGNEIILNNICDADTVSHPAFDDHESRLYRAHEHCMSCINVLRTIHEKGSTQSRKEYLSIAGVLRYLNRKCLFMNGSFATRQNHRDIVDDAVLVIVHAIKHGVIVGGVPAISKACDEVVGDDTMVGQSLKKAFDTVAKATCGFNDPKEVLKQNNKYTSVHYTFESGMTAVDFFNRNDDLDKGVYHVTTPTSYLTNLFKALSDAVMYNAHIRHIVVDGTFTSLGANKKPFLESSID